MPSLLIKGAIAGGGFQETILDGAARVDRDAELRGSGWFVCRRGKMEGRNHGIAQRAGGFSKVDLGWDRSCRGGRSAAGETHGAGWLRTRDVQVDGQRG